MTASDEPNIPNETPAPKSSRLRRLGIGATIFAVPQAILAGIEIAAWGGNPMDMWPISTPHGWSSGDVATDVVVSTALAVGSLVASSRLNRRQDRRQQAAVAQATPVIEREVA